MIWSRAGGRSVAKAQRARALLPVAPIAFTLLEAGVSVVKSAPGANPGVIGTGTVLRGSAIVDRADMVLHAFAGSTIGASASLGATAALATDAFVFNAANLVDYDLAAYGTGSYQSTVQYKRTTSVGLGSPFIMNNSIQVGIATDATVLGVLAFSRSFANLPVNGSTNIQITQVNADGSQTLFNTLPAIAFDTAPGIVYYQLPAGMKNLVVQVSDNLGGLVLPNTAQFYPFDFTAGRPTLGSVTDSYGVRLYCDYASSGRDGLMEEVARALGCYGAVQLGWSGGGYASYAQSPSAYWQMLRTRPVTDARVDITLVSIGINDGPPGAFNGSDPAGLASFEASVQTVWQSIQNQNVGTVLAVVGGWQKASSDLPNPAYYQKKNVLQRLLLQHAGPWVFIDNYLNQWQNSSGAAGNIAEGSMPWITGEGSLFTKAGGGNALNYLQDGTHPASWFGFQTSAAAAAGATTLALAQQADRRDGTVRSAVNLVPDAGFVSIQPPGALVNYAAGQTVAYTMAAGLPDTMTLAAPLAAAAPAGTNVYPVGTTLGCDYVARQLALAVIAGVKAL